MYLSILNDVISHDDETDEMLFLLNACVIRLNVCIRDLYWNSWNRTRKGIGFHLLHPSSRGLSL